MESSEAAQGNGATSESSVSSSLEHLVAGSQGVINKRIDLALLEGRELLSRALQGAALVGLGIILVAAAWLAATVSVVLLVIPDASWAVRFAAFALLNAGTAIGLVTLALRDSRPPAPARRSGNESSREALAADGKS